MFEKASKKLGMEHAVFSQGAFSQADDKIKQDKPSSEEIENLLKFGAYAFLDKDEEDVNAKEIEKTLKEIKEGSQSKEKEGKKKSGAYKLLKSKFEVKDEDVSELLNVNDSDFWNKVLPTLDTVSIKSLEK